MILTALDAIELTTINPTFGVCNLGYVQSSYLLCLTLLKETTTAGGAHNDRCEHVEMVFFGGGVFALLSTCLVHSGHFNSVTNLEALSPGWCLA